jgi:hypothetical protein
MKSLTARLNTIAEHPEISAPPMISAAARNAGRSLRDAGLDVQLAQRPNVRDGSTTEAVDGAKGRSTIDWNVRLEPR